MQRSRIRQQRFQEEGSSSTASVLRSIPRSVSYPQQQSSLRHPTTTSEAKNANRKTMIRSISSDDFENLSNHRHVFKLISILCILGIQLWALGLQSGRLNTAMEGKGDDTNNNIRVGYTNHGSEQPESIQHLINDDDKNRNNRTGSISIAHLGNSIQYFNDCPRMLENMMHQRFVQVTQDSCLRGGANVTTLWEKGNGMHHKFATPSALRPDGTYDIGSPTVEALLLNQKWDFVVINDHTQAPVRPTNKTESIQTFQQKYIPLLEQHNPNATVVLLMTAAYKSHAKNSSDLGDFDNFTQGLVEGYTEYATLFSQTRQLKVKIAPLGLAYQYIKHHNDTAIVKWETLYAPDDFHPSPHGTYLEACLLYCTIMTTTTTTTDGQVAAVQQAPDYNVYWWSRARYMQPHSAQYQPPMALPTREEADYLRTVATHVCNLMMTGGVSSFSSSSSL